MLIFCRKVYQYLPKRREKNEVTEIDGILIN